MKKTTGKRVLPDKWWMTLELPPELQARFRQLAKSHGRSMKKEAEQLIIHAAEQRTEPSDEKQVG